MGHLLGMTAQDYTLSKRSRKQLSSQNCIIKHPPPQSYITQSRLSFSPLPPPSLPPLGKSEEVYGACAAEEHRKGFKVPG